MKQMTISGSVQSLKKSKPKTLTFCIDGKPIPLKRPRFGQGRCWDEQKKTKVAIGILMRNALPPDLKEGEYYFNGPLHLSIEFYLMPSKTNKRNQNKMNGLPYTPCPDLSNLIKFIEDTAQGILYRNDSYIVSISARKEYSSNQRTLVTFREL